MVEQAGIRSRRRPWRRYTFHVDFMAADGDDAVAQAEAYAEGLICLRGEVDSHTARVSTEGNWADSRPVYCGSAGPALTDMCTDRSGHPGRHRADRRLG